MVLDWFRRKPPQEQRQVSFDPDVPVNGAASIAAARRKIIVFREIFPPPREPALSFYGGAPIGPSGMAWPRGEADGKPLTFLMQWDAAALAENDPTGLMPRDGALYLFSSLEWGERMVFRVVHVESDGQHWQSLPLPADLPPAFRAEAARASRLVSTHVPFERQDPPRLLPRWPFVPLAIDLPAPAPADEDDNAEHRFWADSPEVKEAVLRAQDPQATPLPEPSRQRPAFERPFPGFPHDWASMRVIAAAALAKLLPTPEVQWQRAMPDTDPATRETLTATWLAEATALYDAAVAQSPGEAIAGERSDELWRRIEALKPVFWPSFDGVVHHAVNASLGLNSAGLQTIPPEQVRGLAWAHSLATVQFREEYAHEFKKRLAYDVAERNADEMAKRSRDASDIERARNLGREADAKFEQAKAAGELERVRDMWAPTPNRMLGPPSYVQGDVEDYVDDWLLLLELSSSDERGFPLGDGVLQFLIRPEDLAARRFDRVQVVASSY